MEWVCLRDGTALVSGEAELYCPRCGISYAAPGGIPIFVSGKHEAERTCRAVPELRELHEWMEHGGVDEAGERFCAARDCTRRPFGADWKFFLPAPRDARILEIGAGFGDDSVELARASPRTLVVLPVLDHARIIQRQLGERNLPGASVAVLEGLARLPLRNGSIDAIAMEDAAYSGFDVSDRNLAAVVEEWNRVLAPGGTVFLGLSNGFHDLGVVRRLRSRMLSQGPTTSLDRVVKRCYGAARRRGLRLGRTVRTMHRHGFGNPTVYAPLPDENRTQIVVPVEQANVVRYFLNNMIRRNSAVVRAALGLANLSVTLGLFRHLVPYYYLLFRKGAE